MLHDAVCTNPTSLNIYSSRSVYLAVGVLFTL